MKLFMQEKLEELSFIFFFWIDLEKRLKDKRSKQEAELLPVLESRLKKMEEATEITNEIQVSMNEW